VKSQPIIETDSIDFRQAMMRILAGRLHNPQALLGPQMRGQTALLRALRPRAARLSVETRGGNEAMHRIGDTGLFEWRGDPADLGLHPRLREEEADGTCREFVDPYSFATRIPSADLRAFAEGRACHAQRFLGAHPEIVDGIAGTRFAVWAPNAERVSVVGDFNHWDGRVAPMQSRGDSGIWELFVPGIGAGTLYKYELRNRDSGAILVKIDPYARRFETPPHTASVVVGAAAYDWSDVDWMAARALGLAAQSAGDL